MIRIFIILFLISFCSFLFPQNPHRQFENITIEEGLSNNCVNSITQDSIGFVWFGTSEGLNRWDGYTFKIFTHNPDDTNSISNNIIWSLFADDSGQIWVGTHHGLNLYDPQTEKFTRYLMDKNNPNSISNNIIGTMFKDRDGNFWIGTEYGLNRYDNIHKSFSHYFFPGQLDSVSFWWNNNAIRAINETDDGKLLLGTINDFLIFDPQTKETTIIPYFITERKRWPAVSSICKDRSGYFWIGIAADGVIKFDPETGKTRLYQPDLNDPFSYNSKWSTSIIEDINGHIWIGSYDQGFSIFDRTTGRFTQYKPTGRDEKSMGGYIVNNIYQDNKGNMWLGTADGGINLVPKWKKPFRHYVHDPQNPNSLGPGEVMNFFEDKDGMLWIARQYGISLLDRNTGNFSHLTNDPQNPQSMSGGALYAIYEDHYGDLWLAITPDINRLNRKTGKFKHYPHDLADPKSHAYTFTLCCAEDRQGTMWFGTQNAGLEKFNHRKESFERFCFDAADPGSISDNCINTLFQDKEGNFWIGTENGLCQLVYDKYGKEKFIRHQPDPENPYSISGKVVLSLYEDRAGRFWVGTSGGLNLFDRQNGTFRAITKKDGLPINTILGIIEDDHGISENKAGNLWLRTRQGIVKYNPDSGKIRVFDERDGLKYCKTVESGYAAFYKAKSGELFAGSSKAVTVFHPDSLRDNPDPPDILVTDIKINYETVKIGHDSPLQKSMLFTNQIKLTHEQNIISFEFAALDYTAPGRNQYAYKMEGINPDWIYTNASRRFTTYTNLDPGEYFFHVKGSNNDGLWNQDSVSIAILITPPWWETNWAYTSYLIILLILLYFIRQYDLRRQRLKHQLEMEHLHSEKLEELDRIKSRFFANISHEFRTPLTLILGPLESLLSREKNEQSHHELKIMQRSVQRLHKLIAQLLDLSRLEAGKMKLQVREEDIVVMLRSFMQAFESLATLKNIRLIFHSDQKCILAYADREKLETIANNLLSNALKFTPEGGTVKVAVGMKGNFAEIAVYNSDSYIEPEKTKYIFDRFQQRDDSNAGNQKGTGIGLALTKELVEFHKGTISVSSESGKGTTFLLALPVCKEYYSTEELAAKDTQIPPSEVGSAEVGISDDKMITPDYPKSYITRKSLPVVLIVEDNPDMCLYISGNLENDFKIITAENGKAGFEKCTRLFPDLVVSDVMMPEMDGFQLCAKLKTDPRTSHIPVILLTARAALEDKIGGLETGADDYIIKPFNARELQVRVKNMIGQRQKLRERFRKEGTLQPQEIAVTSLDQGFLKKAVEIVEQHISDENFSVDRFGKEIGISRALLHRKLRALTDHSASEFIRSMRLNRAAQLLSKRSGNVTDIAFQVGFNNLSYFAKCFHKQFGISPSLYAAQKPRL